MPTLHKFCHLLLVVALGSVSLRASAQTRYTMHDLGSLGGAGTFARSLNSHGEVVGTAATSSGQFHAFRTSPNSPINSATDDLGTLGGATSTATNVNDQGQVVGSSQTPDLYSHAFRSAPHLPIRPATDDLGTFSGPPSSQANAINEQGQVVGFGSEGILSLHAFRTTPNRPLDESTDDLGGLSITSFPQDTEANSINNAGVVVGSSTTSGNIGHAFRTQPDSPINPTTDDLGTLGGPSSIATDVNDSGYVVGSSGTFLNETHAFLTAPSNTATPLLVDLGTLGGPYSQANALNNSGEVVGSSSTAGGGQAHAFLYSGGAMLDLNTLITPAPSMVLAQANDINDFGQIVANGTASDGTQHGFRLDPTPAGFIYLLIDVIHSFNLPVGATHHLTAQLEECLKSLQRGDMKSSMQKLRDFQMTVMLGRGVQLSASEVDAVLKTENRAASLLLSSN